MPPTKNCADGPTIYSSMARGALLGATVCIAAGLAARALVPTAMSRLGLVVFDTGTIFASYGVVAALQRFAHSALTLKALGKEAGGRCCWCCKAQEAASA